MQLLEDIKNKFFTRLSNPAVAAKVPIIEPEVIPADPTYKVPYTTILDIQPHTNADRLEIATVYGFQVIVSKGRYKVGDKAIYIPIDSILPDKLEAIIFPPDSKIKLNKGRVRQIRIRKLASQGMLINPSEISSIINPSYLKDEQDLKEILNVVKYEPPAPKMQGPSGPKNRNKNNDNPLFHQYNGLNNIKWMPDLFKEGEPVVIQEKLHGMNARASILPYHANTFWKKVKQRLGLTPAIEECYGSNRVQISGKAGYKGFYDEDLHGKCFKSVDVFNKIKLGETVYGEIIGPGIQKNYDYGLKELKFVLFDVKVLQPDGTQRWLTPMEVEIFAFERGFEYVPVLYSGPYNKAMAYELTKGDSVYNPKQKVREGIVIKAQDNYDTLGNKKALKWISEDYLADFSNTDFQ